MRRNTIKYALLVLPQRPPLCENGALLAELNARASWVRLVLPQRPPACHTGALLTELRTHWALANLLLPVSLTNRDAIPDRRRDRI